MSNHYGMIFTILIIVLTNISIHSSKSDFSLNNVISTPVPVSPLLPTPAPEVLFSVYISGGYCRQECPTYTIIVNEDGSTSKNGVSQKPFNKQEVDELKQLIENTDYSTMQPRAQRRGNTTVLVCGI